MVEGQEAAGPQPAYHGLRLGSLHAINKLIDRVLREAADQDALKVARRFAFRHGYRESIYRAGAKSRRALQLAAAAPLGYLLTGSAVSVRRAYGPNEIQQLVIRMATDNRDWGHRSISGALANLGL